MNKWTDGARWRAHATAALLFVSGGAAGVLVDRLWLSPPQLEASPLTGEALAARLGLSSSEAGRVQALLDSLHADVHAAVQEGPDSLRTAVRNAQRRIEEALPPDARSEFHAWMQEHREHMRDRMPVGAMDHGMMHGRGSGAGHTRDQHGRR